MLHAPDARTVQLGCVRSSVYFVVVIFYVTPTLRFAAIFLTSPELCCKPPGSRTSNTGADSIVLGFSS